MLNVQIYSQSTANKHNLHHGRTCVQRAHPHRRRGARKRCALAPPPHRNLPPSGHPVSEHMASAYRDIYLTRLFLVLYLTRLANKHPNVREAQTTICMSANMLQYQLDPSAGNLHTSSNGLHAIELIFEGRRWMKAASIGSESKSSPLRMASRGYTRICKAYTRIRILEGGDILMCGSRKTGKKEAQQTRKPVIGIEGCNTFTSRNKRGAWIQPEVPDIFRAGNNVGEIFEACAPVWPHQRWPAGCRRGRTQHCTQCPRSGVYVGCKWGAQKQPPP